MDQLHRPATHVDKKRLQLLADEDYCREGVEEFQQELDEQALNNSLNKKFSSTFDNNG
jgi:hypothetical protein